MSRRPPTREEALAAVISYRERVRSRGRVARLAYAAAGSLVLVGALPLLVLLPEVGVPAVLLALRLLAVEFEWAARAFAWFSWRWGRLKAWFGGQPRAVRAAIVVFLVALAGAIVLGLVHELA